MNLLLQSCENTMFNMWVQLSAISAKFINKLIKLNTACKSLFYATKMDKTLNFLTGVCAGQVLVITPTSASLGVPLAPSLRLNQTQPANDMLTSAKRKPVLKLV